VVPERTEPFDKPNEPKAGVSAGYRLLELFFKSLLPQGNGTWWDPPSPKWLLAFNDFMRLGRWGWAVFAQTLSAAGQMMNILLGFGWSFFPPLEAAGMAGRESTEPVDAGVNGAGWILIILLGPFC